MWTALALTSVLAAPADLDFKKVRATHGHLGQERKSNKYMPGDLLVLAFDVDGLQVKDDGRVLYAMGMEWTKKGKTKPQYKQDPRF